MHWRSHLLIWGVDSGAAVTATSIFTCIVFPACPGLLQDLVLLDMYASYFVMSKKEAAAT